MKTIEEAAREAVREEYLCEKCAFKDDCNFCGGENTAYDCCECPADSYEDGFKAGAAHIMSLPLCDRMTSEERRKVEDYLRETLKEHDKRIVSSDLRDFMLTGRLMGRLDAIGYVMPSIAPDIFGTAMFEKEGGGE